MHINAFLLVIPVTCAKVVACLISHVQSVYMHACMVYTLRVQVRVMQQLHMVSGKIAVLT